MIQEKTPMIKLPEEAEEHERTTIWEAKFAASVIGSKQFEDFIKAESQLLAMIEHTVKDFWGHDCEEWRVMDARRIFSRCANKLLRFKLMDEVKK